MGGGFVAIIYLVMALIYVFPVLYLYRFATKMKVALKNNDQDFLSSSFENLKSCYKYMGILMAIALGFYAISFLSIIVLGGAAAFFR